MPSRTLPNPKPQTPNPKTQPPAPIPTPQTLQLEQDADVAAALFERSKKNFERALELDPSNSRCR
jgi:hypothetical protein